MIRAADQTAQSGVELLSFLPLFVALLGGAAVLVAAAWSARSAAIVRLLEAKQDQARRYAAFHEAIVSSMNELAITMANYADTPQELARTVQQAADAAPKGAQSLTVSIEKGPLADRVQKATDAWRRSVAQAHAYGDQDLADALAAVDEQRELVVNHLNAENFPAARAEARRLLNDQTVKASQQLQLLALRAELSMVHLLKARRFRTYLNTWERHLLGEIKRGEHVAAGAPPATATPDGG